MRIFNNLIVIVHRCGASQLLYNLWHIVNISTMTVFCLIYRKHYKIKPLPALLTPAIIYALGLLWILLLGWVNSGFQHFGENNIVKGFCFFPIFGLIPSKLFKIDWKKLMDYTAPAFPLLQCVAHIACNFAGCCHGYPTDYGVWNVILKTYMFPCQLLESAVSLVIFIICIMYARKTQYRADGKVYPLFLITFGGTRFFLEFLRDNNKVLFGISDLALWALLMVIVGTIWLLVLKRKNRAI